MIAKATYCLITPFGELCIAAPEAIALGLRATSKGLSVNAIDTPNLRPVIEIEYKHNNYHIYRPLTQFEVVYTDYVDCLNETLLQLAYEMMRLLPGWEMLHCSAAQLDGVNTIAFGSKHVGKSVWAFEQTLNGGQLLADDLLAWDRKRSRFICFGQSSRLRRPVDLKVFEQLDESAFIPGVALSYIKQTHLNIAPCGYEFEPDRIVEIEADTRNLRTLSLSESYARLVKSCIPAERFYPRS